MQILELIAPHCATEFRHFRSFTIYITFRVTAVKIKIISSNIGINMEIHLFKWNFQVNVVVKRSASFWFFMNTSLLVMYYSGLSWVVFDNILSFETRNITNGYYTQFAKYIELEIKMSSLPGYVPWVLFNTNPKNISARGCVNSTTKPPLQISRKVWSN